MPIKAIDTVTDKEKIGLPQSLEVPQQPSLSMLHAGMELGDALPHPWRWK
jgi:hypothetical protein